MDKNIVSHEPYGLRAVFSMERLIHRVPFFCERPISVVLIAAPGAGKSMALDMVKSPRAVRLNDVTRAGLEQLLADKDKRDDRVGLMVVPDLLKLTSETGWASLSSLLNILMEEGLTWIQRYGGRSKIIFQKKMNFALVGAITTGDYMEVAKQWVRTGFDSRILRFYYHYTPEDRHKRDEDIFHQVSFKVIPIRMYQEQISAIKSINIHIDCLPSILEICDMLSSASCRNEIRTDTARFQYQIQQLIRARVLMEYHRTHYVHWEKESVLLGEERSKFFADNGWNSELGVRLEATLGDVWDIASYLPNLIISVDQARVMWNSSFTTKGKQIGLLNDGDVGGSDATWNLLRLFTPDRPTMSADQIKEEMPPHYGRETIARATAICIKTGLLSYKDTVYTHFLREFLP